jgi:hypothetical protein
MGHQDPPAVVSALHMLKLFDSVGAASFDITHTDIEQQRTGFRRDQTLAAASESIPHLIAAADRRQRNIIVRPRSLDTALIQLDDLDEAKARKTAPAAFLILETSPGNYQAWVAVKNAPVGLATRLRKGTEADRSASGATRIAGSANYKHKYGPDFPRVRIAGAKRGHIVTAEELDQMGFLSAAAPTIENAPPIQPGRTSKWPSYEKCLEGAPESESRPGQKRGSVADFYYCQIATSWGHSVEATAARLMQESVKAQENGQKYALDTATRAAQAAQQRNARRGYPKP